MGLFRDMIVQILTIGWVTIPVAAIIQRILINTRVTLMFCSVYQNNSYREQLKNNTFKSDEMEFQLKEQSWWRRCFINVLKSGPIPKHIAFIMDGNRRFARNSRLETIRGHEIGFDSFADVVTMALKLGIEEITTYALSIENLNRPKDELDGLWNLMALKLSKMLDQMDDMVCERVRIQFIGNLSLMPLAMQDLCAEIVYKVQQIREPVLTIYFAICYTSRDEITTSIQRVLSEVQSGVLHSLDIDEKLLNRCICRSKFPVDMIVRTSGETRLSDFLLWQCTDAVLYFTDVLWPKFNSWEMLKSILYFQYYRSKNHISSAKQETLAQRAVTGDPYGKYSMKKIETEKRIDHFMRITEPNTALRLGVKSEIL